MAWIFSVVATLLPPYLCTNVTAFPPCLTKKPAEQIDSYRPEYSVKIAHLHLADSPGAVHHRPTTAARPQPQFGGSPFFPVHCPPAPGDTHSLRASILTTGTFHLVENDEKPRSFCGGQRRDPPAWPNKRPQSSAYSQKAARAGPPCGYHTITPCFCKGMAAKLPWKGRDRGKNAV